MELEIKLSKKSWHYGLQKFVLGREQPNLFSFCPYFWLTITCIFLSPFKLFYRIVEGFINQFDKWFLEGPYLTWLEGLTDEQIFQLYENKGKISKPFRLRWLTNFDILNNWFDVKKIEGGGYSNQFYDIRKKGEQSYMEKWNKKRNVIEKFQKEQRQKRQNRKASRPLNIAKIIRATKVVCFISITLVLASLTYLLIYAIVVWLMKVTWIMLFGLVMLILSIFLIITGVIFVFAFLGYVIKYIVKHLAESERAGDITNSIVDKIVQFIEAIGKFFGFFIDYFKATKNDYCPGITWEEENESN